MTAFGAFLSSLSLSPVAVPKWYRLQHFIVVPI